MKASHLQRRAFEDAADWQRPTSWSRSIAVQMWIADGFTQPLLLAQWSPNACISRPLQSVQFYTDKQNGDR
jgi:hypothetical protein